MHRYMIQSTLRQFGAHRFASTLRPVAKESVKKGYKTRYIVVGSLAVCTVLYNTNDTVHDSTRHLILTMRRVGVVSIATTRCFYHYKRILGKTYKDKEVRNIELSRCHKKCALITLHALQSNGGIFIKLGQHIGALTYLLPSEWTQTMVPLQDQCPESTLEDIQEMIAEDMGSQFAELFEDVNPKPIGVASLAQVYVGKLRATGQEVAIKCQHPSLKEFVPLDVLLTRTVFEMLDIVFPEYPLTWLGDELQSSIYEELDFTKEAENAVATAKYFDKFTGLTALRIPKVIQANNRVLIMEYIAGKRLDDLDYLKQNRISPSEVSSCLSHIFNNMIFTPNVGLHCDPHGGNLAIRSIKPTKLNKHNFEIILFDHGLYRHPTTQTRRDYAKFWLAMLDHDQEKMVLYANKFANVTEDQFPLFAAAISGRSIDVALNYDITKRRTNEEISQMTSRLLQGHFLADIMRILSRVPRIVLLILKTNDLTRYLDECLHNPLGPERTFLIMTQYCAKTVFDEDVEEIDNLYTKWSFKWCWHYLLVWSSYERRKNQLVLYDTIFWWRQKVNKFLKLI
ncbi:Cqd2p KNAG_0I01420 [Huiozyma naganishii CBS 8797]|uniref:ABC1 atypical kinase-like domain-containing protein n=1 Tax=Huiozyma naganishii (strain ATCC MYA-139 / BCRC 22969 / CBS 8797 / KCTC 17520 / NBRC 10181 / NCYC 3082 / Yp74L-3) TaxID=1071383 RepID=J7SA58_HUIN7|nr:hypothetical protein KNAG_0I01420 [Kazachstania naganishii CBS 8797]CCK71931.1 hypothetical protein KNAG_0I01420 [Kazachstania naganishii CBS 8797]